MDGRNSLAAQANHEATTDQVQDSAGLEDLEPVSPLSEVLTSPSLPALPPQGEIPASQIPAALPPEEYAGASPTTAAPPPGGEVVPTTAAPTPALPPHQGSVGAPTTPAARPPSSDDGGKVAASWIRLTHWWLEIGANICSLGIAIATIVLLRKYDGTPVASWTFGLSLNTIVAILAGVSSAMLAFSVSECIGQQKWNWIRTRPMSLQSFEIFDEASRGPWGATRLLWSLRAKHWSFLGAISVIMLLAYDPLLQAVISYDYKPSIVGNPGQRVASLPKTDRLDVGVLIPASTEVWDLSISAADPNMVFAIARGIQYPTSPIRIPLQTSCSTGNCTWSQFTTLGVCSSCVPLSNLAHNPDPNYAPSDGPNGDSVSINATIDPRKSVNFQNYETLLVAFSITGFFSNVTMTSTECAIYFCSKTFEAEADNDIFEETLVRSDMQRENKSYWCSGVDTAQVPSTQFLNSGCLLYMGSQIWVPEGDFLRYDLQLINPTNESEKFNISQTAITTTGQALLTTMNVTDSQGLGEFGMYDQPRHGFHERLINASRDSDLPKTFDQIAEAMTNVTRNYGTNPHIGATYQWIQHFDIQWFVLILPAIVFITSYIFFIWTLFDTRKIAKPTWKESIIPMLLYSFEEDTRVLLRDAAAQGPTELEDTVSRYVVFFDQEKERLELCTHVQPVRFRSKRACPNCQIKTSLLSNVTSSPI